MLSSWLSLTWTWLRLVMRCGKTCAPKYATLAYWLFGTETIWKTVNGGGRLSLNLSYLIKDRSSKGSSITIDHLPGTREHWVLSQEREPEVDSISRQTLLQTVIPLIYSSKDHSSFLKIIHSVPGDLHFPSHSLLTWYLIPNSKPPWEATHFSLHILHIYRRHPG